jgi:hypothetical protein
MSQLHIANSRGRDAVVAGRSLTGNRAVHWVDDRGEEAESRKILRAGYAQDFEALRQRFGEEPDAIAQAIIDGDPEVDLERFGSILRHPVRVYVGPGQTLVHHVDFQEIVRNPDGTEKTRRPRRLSESNVASGLPVKWTGKKFPKAEVYNRFVFSSKLQIVHVNGLTYDFLFEMAQQLEAEKCLMRVGGGPKGTEPLIFRRGGLPYHGFLEGRTDGKRYALILHLTNLELRRPAVDKEKPVESPAPPPKPEEPPAAEAPPAPPAPEPEAEPIQKKKAAKKAAATKSATRAPRKKPSSKA